MIHLFLHSKDSLDNHPNNFAFDFTIDLQDILYLEGYWECALREIKLSNNQISGDYYLFTDICVDSYLLNNYLPVIRQFSTSQIFQNSYFFKVNRKEISTIRLYIKNQNLETPSIELDSVSCVLSFRKLK